MFWSLSDVLPSVLCSFSDLLSFLYETKPQGTARWRSGSSWIKCSKFLPLCFVYFSFATQPAPFREVFKTTSAWLSCQFPSNTMLAELACRHYSLMKFTFSLFWLKHILAKQRTSHFAILTPCATALLLYWRLFPRQNSQQLDMPFALGTSEWNLEPDHECFKGNMKLGYRWWLVYGCLVVFLYRSWQLEVVTTARITGILPVFSLPACFSFSLIPSTFVNSDFKPSPEPLLLLALM